MGISTSEARTARSLTAGMMLLLCGVSLSAQERGTNGTLLVEVSGFADSQGQATIMVLNSKEAFAAAEMRSDRDKWKKVHRDLKDVKIQSVGDSRFARHEFGNLSPGDYVVFVMHDRNSNGKLDSNLIGVPLEPFGMSNNFRPQLLPIPQRPTWEKLAFAVKPGQNRIVIQLQN